MSETEENEIKSKKKNYRRDKPWDNENIDHWSIEVSIYIISNIIMFITINCLCS